MTSKRTAADVSTKRVIPMEPRSPYGMELVIDLHDCDHTLFNRDDLKKFFKELCELIDMEREELHFWDYSRNPKAKAAAPPHLKGTSAVQFIQTSSIVLHALDDLRRVYVNIFSCREFDVHVAVDFCERYFGSGWCGHRSFERN